MFDLIGDVHGCIDELAELLSKLGYTVDMTGPNPHGFAHKDGRKVVFVGDLNDRGPNSFAVIRVAIGMVREGNALCILGNHDDKLRRALRPGSKVKPSHGLDVTLKQLESQSEMAREEVRLFLESLPYQLSLDGGKLQVSHAGLPEKMHGVDNGRVRSHALYGDVDGTTDPVTGFPVRKDWAANYHGSAVVVHGHVPVREVVIKNNVYDIDTGCCFGNKLTALRYPEMELVQVPAKQNYQPFHPFGTTS